MAINLDLVGKTYPAAPVYEVGREKIREFATAIGDDNPAYHDVAAAQALGHRDVIAPPTFAIIVSFLAASSVVNDAELGLDYSRVVHGEQRFTYSRPVTAGDQLVATATIENLRIAAGNDMVTTRTDITTVDGEHVVTTTSVIVSRAAGADA
jgi:acyl dehydratase